MRMSKSFLLENLYAEGKEYFGVNDKSYIESLADRWENDQVPDSRWNEMISFNDHNGKILDMACGVGTFLFYGLCNGYDVYGVEPERWKLKYMNMKIDELSYPQDWKNRIFNSTGEELPFDDNSFDYVVTYQTLEHVQNTEECLNELIRVLKPGGKLKIHAPDYNSCFEPHYKVPFLPKMNITLAKYYLMLLQKPIKGLYTLRWTTSEDILKFLSEFDNLEFIDLSKLYKERRILAAQNKFGLMRCLAVIIVNIKYYRRIYLLQEEKQINIIIKKHKN